MRKNLLAFLFIGIGATATVSAQTQIPNGGFETWVQGNPTSWGTSDRIITSLFQPDPGGVEQETNAADVYVGTSAIRLTNKSVNLPQVGAQTIPGVVTLGTLTLNFATFQPQITGLAYTDRPDSISFAAKFANASGGNDTGAVIITLTRWTPTNERQIIANTIVRISELASYAVFTRKIVYNSMFAPDTLLIQGVTSTSQNAVIDTRLWLDDMKFIGLDTTFKAYITPTQDLSACTGDTVNFATDEISPNTYVWFKDGAQVPSATNSFLNATAGGNYYVVVTTPDSIYTSDTVNVVYNTTPVVTFTLPTPITALCNDAAPVTLSGGSPSGAGGSYFGDGVIQGSFDPADAGIGTHTVTYEYTSNGCTAEATQDIEVTSCTDIEILEAGVAINIYPNPATSNIVLETNSALTAGSYEVYDLQGKLILKEAINSSKSILNVSVLQSGSYIIRVLNAGSKTVANAKVNVMH